MNNKETLRAKRLKNKAASWSKGCVAEAFHQFERRRDKKSLFETKSWRLRGIDRLFCAWSRLLHKWTKKTFNRRRPWHYEYHWNCDVIIICPRISGHDAVVIPVVQYLAFRNKKKATYLLLCSFNLAIKIRHG